MRYASAEAQWRTHGAAGVASSHHNAAGGLGHWGSQGGRRGVGVMGVSANGERRNDSASLLRVRRTREGTDDASLRKAACVAKPFVAQTVDAGVAVGAAAGTAVYTAADAASASSSLRARLRPSLDAIDGMERKDQAQDDE